MKQIVHEAYLPCKENEKTFLVLGKIKDKKFKLKFDNKEFNPLGFFDISLGVGGNRFKGIENIISNHIKIDSDSIDYIINTKKGDSYKFSNITICIVE